MRGEGCGGVGEERAEAGPAGFGTVVGEEGNDGGELDIRGSGGWVVEVEGGVVAGWWWWHWRESIDYRRLC